MPCYRVLVGVDTDSRNAYLSPPLTGLALWAILSGLASFATYRERWSVRLRFDKLSVDRHIPTAARMVTMTKARNFIVGCLCKYEGDVI